MLPTRSISLSCMSFDHIHQSWGARAQVLDTPLMFAVIMIIRFQDYKAGREREKWVNFLISDTLMELTNYFCIWLRLYFGMHPKGSQTTVCNGLRNSHTVKVLAKLLTNLLVVQESPAIADKLTRCFRRRRAVYLRTATARLLCAKRSFADYINRQSIACAKIVCGVDDMYDVRPSATRD